GPRPRRAPAESAGARGAPPGPRGALPIAPSTPIGERKWYERFTPFGYAKLGLFYTVPFQDEQLVGSNGGFRLANVRLGVQFDPRDDFTVVVSLEAAPPQPDPHDPTP